MSHLTQNSIKDTEIRSESLNYTEENRKHRLNALRPTLRRSLQ